MKLFTSAAYPLCRAGHTVGITVAPGAGPQLRGGWAVARKISESTIRRLSFYLRFLEEFERAGHETVSSDELVQRGNTTAAQVRKDLSLFGSFGKRGLGYNVRELSETLRGILGLERTWRVALVGAGRIGSALFAYDDFRQRGFSIVAVLDSDPEKVGRVWEGVTIQDASELEQVLHEEAVEIVIFAVPAAAAQAMVDRVVDAGVKAILNFAPTQLKVPADVAVQDVNMSMELEALSFALSGGASHIVGSAVKAVQAARAPGGSSTE